MAAINLFQFCLRKKKMCRVSFQFYFLKTRVTTIDVFNSKSYCNLDGFKPPYVNIRDRYEEELVIY